MNIIERYIYNVVRFSPRLKKLIVKIYQLLFSMVPIKRAKSDFNIITREGYYFGFHDKYPWSNDNKYLLTHKINIDLKMPDKDDQVEIGYFKGKDFDQFVPIGSTKTWNWQMGSMLQWIGDNNNVILNDFDGEKDIAKRINLNGNTLQEYNRPIAAISQNGKYGLSHSFIRLRNAAPAYGYANGEDETSEESCPQNDGIFLIDLKTGKSEMILSLAQFAGMVEYSKDAYHYFTHCLFSPNGKRFAFYHRWVEKNGQTWTKLYTCDLNGNNLHLFTFSNVVTHMAWYNENQLLAYGLKKGVGDNYYLLQDESNDYSIIGEEDFASDGHPQFQLKSNRFITDTYPDRFRRQYLILYDLGTSIRKNIAILRSPLKFSGDIRCDLHPRWDRTGDHVCFDSAHSGIRSLCTIKLK